MKKKRCFKCGRKKLLKEFYKHSQMADGHLNKCKVCTRKDVSDYSKTEKGRLTSFIRGKQPGRKAYRADHLRRYRKKYPEKNRARWKLREAVKRGEVKKGPCEMADDTCSGIIEGHHEDYNRPLEATWLCTKHHKEWERRKE